MIGLLTSLNWNWPGFFLLGIVIGLLTGMFGVGGGFLLTPCLKVFFGMPFPLAVGSSLATIFCTGSVSAYRHGRRGNVAWRLGMLMAAGALIGTRLGKGGMTLLQASSTPVHLWGRTLNVLDLSMNLLFLVLLCTVFAVVDYEKRHPNAREGDDDPAHPLACRLHAWRFPPHIRLPREGVAISVWIPLALSFGVGILTGLLGVGGGFVMFPILVYVVGLPTRSAVGTSAFQLVFAGGFGTLLYARHGLVDLPTVGLLVAGAFIGAEIGVRLASVMDVRRLRGHFGYIVLVGVGVVLFDLASMFRL